MNVLVGTSGFQYAEWKGNFYPENITAQKMLSFYAEHFLTTEINYTFHRTPSVKTIGNWTKLTPEHFRFSLKAPQKITHWAKLRNCADSLNFFERSVSGLGSQLGPILFQLPPSFKQDKDLLNDFLTSLPAGLRAAFEFRHTSWFEDEIFAVLREHQAALCIAENSDIATPTVATADFGYLRLRRQDYEEADIRKWAETVLALQNQWNHVFVYFKHEESGLGPKLAKQMMQVLG